MQISGILDADKEGFLRSETSLFKQLEELPETLKVKVILYADKETKSIKKQLKKQIEEDHYKLNLIKKIK